MKDALEALMQKANALQSQDTEQCINTYKEAIQMMDKHPEIKTDYYYLYAHYLIMMVYPKLGGDPNFPGEKYDALTVDYAKRCLAIVNPIFVYAHFTETGLFHEEVIRSSSNGIAWHSLQTTDSQEGLQELLDHLNRGCEYAFAEGSDPDPKYMYIHDTKVSVLMKMGKTEEAYKLVWLINKADKDYKIYGAVDKTDAYKAWLEKEGLDSVDTFVVDEETHKTETAEQAYQRLLKAEAFYNKTWERDNRMLGMEEIEKFEKEHFKLSDSYRSFILKYGYVQFGRYDDEYNLFPLDSEYTFEEILEELDIIKHKEDIMAWFETDYIFVFCNGDSTLQTHFACLMDKENCYFYDLSEGPEGAYTFDEFVSRVANYLIEAL